MLSKVLKYDLRYVFKFLAIFYGLGLFFALFSRFIFMFERSIIIDIIGYISIGATISMIFNILINSLTRNWVRFKYNFYNDESYLTHTLPVKKETLYLSKFITSVISFLVSFLVIILILFIVYYTKDNVRYFKYILDDLLNSFGGNYITIVGAIVLIFFEIMALFISGLVGIIVGQRFNDNKVLLSFAFSFVVYFVTQLVVFLSIMGFAFVNDCFDLLFLSNDFSNPLVGGLLLKLIYTSLFAYGLLIVVWFFIGMKTFKKGVNVD